MQAQVLEEDVPPTKTLIKPYEKMPFDFHPFLFFQLEFRYHDQGWGSTCYYEGESHMLRMVE